MQIEKINNKNKAKLNSMSKHNFREVFVPNTNPALGYLNEELIFNKYNVEYILPLDRSVPGSVYKKIYEECLVIAKLDYERARVEKGINKIDAYEEYQLS